MKELIRIEKQIINNDEVNSVTARDLWQALESKQEFTHWVKARLEQAYAVENEDYVSFDKIIKRETGATKAKEYALSLDLAKNIAMLERNEKGNQVRKYFIACEKELRKQIKAPTNMVEALELALEQAKQINALNEKIEQDKPKVAFAEAVTNSEHCISITELSRYLQNIDVNIGRNKLYDYLRDKGYLIKSGRDKNLPTQQYIKQGLFKVVESVVNYGTYQLVTKSTLVTGKGQQYFLNKFSAYE